MRVLVLGAGAVGGYFGGRLQQAGVDVEFLVRPRRQEQLGGELRIESPLGDARLKIKARLQSELEGSFDFVLLSCKAYDLESSMDSIAPGVGPNTAIIPMLNGMRHLDALNARFGQERVLGGVAKIYAGLGPEGSIRHDELQEILFGEQQGGISDRVQSFAAAFDGKLAKGTPVPDILQKMWDKLVMISASAGGTSLFRASAAEIVKVPGGREFLRELLDCASRAAAAEGYPVRPEANDAVMGHFDSVRPVMISSMLRDIQRGGPIEREAIVGLLIDLFQKHSLDPGPFRIIDMTLRAYENSR